jgi:hypothetical protein
MKMCSFCSRDAQVITMVSVDKPMCIHCYRAFKFGLGIDESEFIESTPITLKERNNEHK